MAFPLLVLASFTLILGFCQGYLEKLLLGESHPHAMNYFLLVAAVSCAVGGIAVAWFDWGRKDAKCVGFISKFPALQTFFIQKWYMDHFWRWFLNRFIYGILFQVVHVQRPAGGGWRRGRRGLLYGGQRPAPVLHPNRVFTV